jgi:FtsP/CotA-like multicopper oxidase with cupredoxin domain
MSMRAIIGLIAVVAILILVYYLSRPAPEAPPPTEIGAEPPLMEPHDMREAPMAPELAPAEEPREAEDEHAMMDMAETETAQAVSPSTAPPAHGGHDMTPIDVEGKPVLPLESRGNRQLESKLMDGVRVFELTTSVVQWHILPEAAVAAYVYNEQLPGPLIRLKPGEKVRINVKNLLPEATTVHWHGLDIDNAADGVPFVTQPPIEPGQSFAYEFTVPNSPGTFFYHTHLAFDRQQVLGLFGALIIDNPKATETYAVDYPVLLNEHRFDNGKTLPAMEFDGLLPNYFTINGKSFPATETLKAKVGDRLLFRFVGAGAFAHPMHIHGGPFEIVATDGHPVPKAARLTKDTVMVSPGERYDVVWTARKAGTWMLHCHIGHHITNDGREVSGAGGLTMAIEVAS